MSLQIADAAQNQRGDDEVEAVVEGKILRRRSEDRGQRERASLPWMRRSLAGSGSVSVSSVTDE
jgi:hypothetical protein